MRHTGTAAPLPVHSVDSAIIALIDPSASSGLSTGRPALDGLSNRSEHLDLFSVKSLIAMLRSSSPRSGGGQFLSDKTSLLNPTLQSDPVYMKSCLSQLQLHTLHVRQRAALVQLGPPGRRGRDHHIDPVVGADGAFRFGRVDPATEQPGLH